MRLKIVAAAIVAATIVATLLASTVTVHGFALPAKMPFIAGDYGQMPFYDGNSVSTHDVYGNDNFFKGLTSVDYLGKVRDLSGTGRLSSMFPETWLAGRSSGAPEDRAEYLGFTYVRSGAPAPAGNLFYTGEQSGGRRIYVSAAGYSPPGIPGLIFLRYGDRYTAYSLSDAPPVYAYVLYGAFNANESVRFGMVNNGGGSLDLMNAAPFEIQRKDGGTWRTVFAPVAAQVITPVQNGTAKEWQWDQLLDDESAAPIGDYRVLIAGKYAASFRLASDTPAVERSKADYDRVSVTSVADNSVIPQAFGKAYPSPSADTREDIVSIMQFKARALGLDPASLRRAIDATGTGALPCLAVYARFEGRPAWIIAFSSGAGTSAIPGTGVYAVDEASGDVVHKP
jgi:hypothetical protein